MSENIITSSSRFAKIVAVLAVILFIGGILFFFFCVNYTEVNEIGVAYNMADGSITAQDAGWYITKPWVKVAYLNTLPLEVKIPSQAKVIVRKYVRFVPAGLEEYIRLQGFSYSMNSALPNVLLGYAFSGNEYPFFVIIQDSEDADLTDLRPLDLKDEVTK